jgi:hypothetical protein
VVVLGFYIVAQGWGGDLGLGLKRGPGGGWEGGGLGVRRVGYRGL